LLYQILDSKKECYAVYCAGNLYHYPNSLDLSKTWSHSEHVFDNSDKIEYAQIWCGGKSLAEVCPDDLKEEWKRLSHRGKAFLKSFNNAKINLEDVCFYDLVPKKYLIEYCMAKDEITNHVFDTFKKPKNYDFIEELIIFVKKIESRKLNIDLSSLKMGNKLDRLFKNRIKKLSPRVKYNPWGSVTGRLTTEPNSFPVLTLKKEHRSVLKPNNDWFIELDYNAAEVRTLFSLMGANQPKGDIHSWIASNIFKSKYSRDETKKKVFAWLYNPKATNKKLSSILDKEQVFKKYYLRGVLSTPFDRDIQVEEGKALNYLIQSTSSDNFLQQAIKLSKLLDGRKSYISFCVHDSLVIDFSEEDKDMLKDLVEIFSNTKLGVFKANVHAGKDFLNMKELNI
tara:strand:+ start:4431 stop:5618 length:1188 start_codon:yes stop_codon:yes gene_type:complete